MNGIYLARPGEDGLTYAGKLERGFSDEDKAAMLKRLTPLRTRRRIGYGRTSWWMQSSVA